MVRMKRSTRRFIALVLGLTAACATTDDTPRTGDQPGSPSESVELPPIQLPLAELPDDWRTLPADAFARDLDARPERFTFDEPTRASLRAALEETDVTGDRAAILLARSGSSGELLLEHLEARRRFETRGGDASSVIAAAGLRRYAPDREWGARLARLVVGPVAHPDLEVRVECAISAIAHGSTAPLPFLVAVCRIDTWEGRSDTLDFEPARTTAWARERAAECLSRAAGIANDYRADASLVERQASVRRFAEALKVTLPVEL